MDTSTFVVTPDEVGGYCARAVGYSIFTEADSFEELLPNIREATEVYFNGSEHMPRQILVSADVGEFVPA
jgi:predicted RNase H-like HicB family nuclease